MSLSINRKMEVGVDLGTANTLIIVNDKIIIDEPSIIALNRESNQVIAVGNEAMLMHEKVQSKIKTIKPLQDGVIADFSACQLMIKHFIQKVKSYEKSMFSKSLTLLICIPSGITEVEKRAVRDSAIQAGAQEVLMIFEPMAAAIGAGFDVTLPNGIMVIDIGGGTTDIAVLSLSGIVYKRSLRIAGNSFTTDIINYVRKNYNLLIGERTAEKIKMTLGSALTELADEPCPYEIVGRDLLTGIPKNIEISYQEIAFAMEKSLSKIEEGILEALESTPPELASDIHRNGIFISGGGALIRGIEKRFSEKMKLKISIVEDPLKSVVKGTGIALKNRINYKSLLIN